MLLASLESSCNRSFTCASSSEVGGRPRPPQAWPPRRPAPGDANGVTTSGGINGGETGQQPSSGPPPTPTDANVGGAAQDPPAAPTADGEEDRPAPPIALQSTAEVDGTAARGDAAADADATPAGDAGISENEAESTRAMDVEATLASIPVEQRARVREALARRRKDQKGPRKLKKPTDDSVKGVGGDGKKPTK